MDEDKLEYEFDVEVKRESRLVPLDENGRPAHDFNPSGLWVFDKFQDIKTSLDGCQKNFDAIENNTQITKHAFEVVVKLIEDRFEDYDKQMESLRIILEKQFAANKALINALGILNKRPFDV